MPGKPDSEHGKIASQERQVGYEADLCHPDMVSGEQILVADEGDSIDGQKFS